MIKKSSIVFSFSVIFLAAVFSAIPLLTQAQNISSPYVFSQNLSLGSQNGDVFALQQLLNNDPGTLVAEIGPGSKGRETTYFGPATRNAVIRFQEKYSGEVLAPAGLVAGSGFVGNFTRAKLNSLEGTTLAFPTASGNPLPSVQPTETPLTPRITSISPVNGPNGTEITITGSNFTSKNTVVTSFMLFPDIPSTDGKTIRFTFDNPPFDELQKIRNKTNNIKDLDIPLQILVANENGTSTSPFLFTIQIKKS